MSDDPVHDDEVSEEDHSFATWALDTFVYAPTGLLFTAVEDMPELVAKGRARIELQMKNAQFLGRFVVDHGKRDLERRLGRTRADAPARPGPIEVTPSPTPAPAASHPYPVPPVGGFAPAPRDLAIPDYDTLSASQVVRRLDGLGEKELQAVYRHEASTRGRRTILHRAQQLLGTEASPGVLSVVVIRRATPGDLARCAELVAEAADEASASRGGDLAEGLRERRSTVEEWAEAGILLVGEYEGATVGVGAGTVADPVLGDGRRLGRIECCYVEADAREVGVGEALVEELLLWFAGEDCTDVDALALPGDRRTKQLYERSGFKARLLTLHRPLG